MRAGKSVRIDIEKRCLNLQTSHDRYLSHVRVVRCVDCHTRFTVTLVLSTPSMWSENCLFVAGTLQSLIREYSRKPTSPDSSEKAAEASAGGSNHGAASAAKSSEFTSAIPMADLVSTWTHDLFNDTADDR